jgi:hypothetical protein
MDPMYQRMQMQADSGWSREIKLQFSERICEAAPILKTADHHED